MIERTFDTELVRELLSDEKLNARIAIDGDVQVFDPERQDHMYYLLAIEDGKIKGVVVFHAFNHQICYQIHLNYLSKYWGTKLSHLTKEAMEWVFKNTDAEKVAAFSPTLYPKIKIHLERAGLKDEGLLTASSRFNDELYDNHVMGVSKEQIC